MLMKDKTKETLKVLLAFMKIGAFTFGGGYAMISLIGEECVEKHGWMSADELADMIAVAESTPGPVAVNSATYVGYKVGGFWGALAATAGVVSPAFLLIFLISLFFDDFLAIPLVAKAFKGIKVGVCVLIALVGVKMFIALKKTAVNVIMFAAVLAVLLAANLLNIGFSSVYLILAAAAAGMLIYGISERRGGGR